MVQTGTSRSITPSGAAAGEHSAAGPAAGSTSTAAIAPGPQLQQLQQEPSPQSLIQKQLPEEIMLLDQVKIIMVSPAIDKKNLQY